MFPSSSQIELFLYSILILDHVSMLRIWIEEDIFTHMLAFVSVSLAVIYFLQSRTHEEAHEELIFYHPTQLEGSLCV